VISLNATKRLLGL